MFNQLVTKNQRYAAISDHPTQGFCIPFQDTITPDRIPASYKYYLYDDVDATSMNTLNGK